MIRQDPYMTPPVPLVRENAMSVDGNFSGDGIIGAQTVPGGTDSAALAPYDCRRISRIVLPT